MSSFFSAQWQFQSYTLLSSFPEGTHQRISLASPSGKIAVIREESLHFFIPTNLSASSSFSLGERGALQVSPTLCPQTSAPMRASSETLNIFLTINSFPII